MQACDVSQGGKVHVRGSLPCQQVHTWSALTCARQWLAHPWTFLGAATPTRTAAPGSAHHTVCSAGRSRSLHGHRGESTGTAVRVAVGCFVARAQLEHHMPAYIGRWVTSSLVVCNTRHSHVNLRSTGQLAECTLVLKPYTTRIISQGRPLQRRCLSVCQQENNSSVNKLAVDDQPESCCTKITSPLRPCCTRADLSIMLANPPIWLDSEPMNARI